LRVLPESLSFWTRAAEYHVNATNDAPVWRGEHFRAKITVFLEGQDMGKIDLGRWSSAASSQESSSTFSSSC